MKKRNSIARRVMSLVLGIMLLCTILILPASAKGDVAAEAATAVVRVLAIDPLTGQPSSTGSAFGIAAEEGEAPQYFITNWHVINPEVTLGVNEQGQLVTGRMPATQIYLMKTDQAMTINYLRGEFMLENSQLIPCEVVYEGAQYPDMAILRAAQPFEGRTNLPIREPEESRDRAQAVYALGYPGVNDDTNLDNDKWVLPYPADIEDVSITKGVFSHMAAMKTYDNYVHIEHDARINKGNSGGPLIDENGTVIGINTYLYVDNSVDSYYSVSAQYVIDVLDDLNIPYRTEGGMDLTTILIIAGAAIAVLTVIVIMVIVLKKGKNRTPKGKQPVGPSQPAVPPVLHVYAERGALAGNTLTITGLTKFGRNVAGIRFPENTAGVSNEHCQIYFDSASNQYWLMDLNSSFGTYANGQKMTPNVPVRLHSGVVFCLGSQEQAFRVL